MLCPCDCTLGVFTCWKPWVTVLIVSWWGWNQPGVVSVPLLRVQVLEGLGPAPEEGS